VFGLSKTNSIERNIKKQKIGNILLDGGWGWVREGYCSQDVRAIQKHERRIIKWGKSKLKVQHNKI